jgi:hypothetical protein
MPLVYPLKLYAKHPATAALFCLGVLVNAIVWALLLTQVPRESDQVFLHYTIFFGVDDIGPWRRLLIVPAAGLFIVLANGIFGWWAFSRDKFLAHLMNAGAALCQLFLLASSFLLVTLNS